MTFIVALRDEREWKAMNVFVAEYVLPILIGVLSSLVASIMFLLFNSRIRPKVEISRVIAKRPVSGASKPPVYAVKVVNKGRRPVIAVRAELHLVTPTQIPAGYVLITQEIKLKRSDLLEIPGFNRKDTEARHAFRFLTYEDLDALWSNDAQTYIRFRMYATDSLSGFGRVFTQDYHTKRRTLKPGDFHFGDSFEVE